MTTRKTSTRRRAPRRSSSTYRRRRTPTIGATLGTALGALVVTWLTNASWPMRIGVVVAVVILGLLFLLWSRRAEIAAMAAEQQGAEASTTASTTDPTTDPETTP